MSIITAEVLATITNCEGIEATIYPYNNGSTDLVIFII